MVFSGGYSRLMRMVARSPSAQQGVRRGTTEVLATYSLDPENTMPYHSRTPGAGEGKSSIRCRQSNAGVGPLLRETKRNGTWDHINYPVNRKIGKSSLLSVHVNVPLKKMIYPDDWGFFRHLQVVARSFLVPREIHI